MALTIRGHSDDLVELNGCKEEELYSYHGAVKLLVGHQEARQGEDAAGVIVVMEYGSGNLAVWSATIHQIDEDILCPWSVSLTFKGYSPTVTIDCPDNTPVHFWNPKSQKWQNTDRREED